MKYAHIRMVVVLIVIVAVNKVDIGVLGDGSGVSLHNDDFAFKSCEIIDL